MEAHAGNTYDPSFQYTNDKEDHRTFFAINVLTVSLSIYTSVPFTAWKALTAT